MGEASAVKRAEEPISSTKNVSLFDQMENTFNTIARRAYEIFEGNGRMLGRDLENWFRAEKELFHPVPVNITESEGAIEVKAEVPGFSEKEIEIGVEPRRLTITGRREIKREEKKGKTVYAESRSDEILRLVDLPAEIETDKVAATLKNGILELALPKVAKRQTLRIRPKTA